MKRLLIAACLITTACAAATPAQLPPAPMVVDTLAPQYALQDAQATGTAAARAVEATATTQANRIATEARASILLAEQQTQAANALIIQQTQAALPGEQTATAIANNLLVATATEGAAHNATQVAATLAADVQSRTRNDLAGNVGLGVGVLTLGIITLVVCAMVLRIGRAYEARVRTASVVIVRNGEAPVGYLLPSPNGPRYHSLTGGHPLAIEAEPDPDQQCREAWRRAIKEIANNAAQIGSWSVNRLSTRNGAGEWPEDTVLRAQVIVQQIGAIANYGGTRGWDWANAWDYITLTSAIDNGVLFDLPRTTPPPGQDVGAVCWPVFPDQSQAKQRQAKQAKRRPVTA